MREWQTIETAPKDGTIIDVWLGEDDLTEQDRAYYCPPGSRRSAAWQWFGGKFKPAIGIQIAVFVIPTHWMPLPEPPK